jgi:hypothetical protein
MLVTLPKGTEYCFQVHAITCGGSTYKWEWLYLRNVVMFQQYKQAEEAFERVIQLDEDCEDAKQELETVKIQQLMEMGFVEDQAFAAIQQYGTVQVWALPCTLNANVFCLFSPSECFNIKELCIFVHHIFMCFFHLLNISQKA